MHLQPQSVAQKHHHIWKYFKQATSVCGKNDKIVSVADIILRFKFMLHELVKLVHVDIHEKLRGQIAERQSLSQCSTREAFNNSTDKPENIFVGYEIGRASCRGRV